MAETVWLLHKLTMMFARRIEEQTGMKIVGSSGEKIVVQTANSTDEKIGGRIDNLIGEKTDGKIGSLTGGRIVAQTRVANSVVLIELIASPANMVVTGETMPE